jgi:deazaflavin-dependent oxidoreductase (nitroreductase family)
MAGQTMAEFREPTGIEKLLNQLMGALAGWGMGPKYIYLLQVRGRKSGRIYSTPVYLMDVDAKRYLIAPRGRTQWVRNAEAAGEIVLKRGTSRESFRLQEIAGGAKNDLLKEYLERYVSAVQRYFPVKAGSPPEAFREIASSYPVYELLPQ